MKKVIVSILAVSCAVAAFAAPRVAPGAMPGAEGNAVAQGREAKVNIDQFPKTGQASALSAPQIQGQTTVGKCYQKPRKWLVFEMKYTTFVKWQDQLTFTWHVLLETKSATENKGNKEGLAPYSYFTTSTTYQNIPQGSHAASVCLHPSYLERFGEAKAVGLVITNAKGEELQGDSESEINGIAKHTKWWENQDIMNKQQADGKPMIERRQGLMDRSKTIWALVNPNDYEQVAQ